LRVVLDTNVLVSALLFRTGRLVWLREAWHARRLVPLIDKPCAEELIRVLAYPKFGLDPWEIRALLSDYLPYTETVDTTTGAGEELPECADPHDQKFLVLARAGLAEALVTGDRALLNLVERVDFAILTPSQFRARLDPA
jgi:putative PIN family toxin of toxin-antitoxin system